MPQTLSVFLATMSMATAPPMDCPKATSLLASISGCWTRKSRAVWMRGKKRNSFFSARKQGKKKNKKEKRRRDSHLRIQAHSFFIGGSLALAITPVREQKHIAAKIPKKEPRNGQPVSHISSIRLPEGHVVNSIPQRGRGSPSIQSRAKE